MVEYGSTCHVCGTPAHDFLEPNEAGELVRVCKGCMGFAIIWDPEPGLPWDECDDDEKRARVLELGVEYFDEPLLRELGLLWDVEE